jgi:hypothetical protein
MAKSDPISEREAIRRRDDVLRVMLRTPPKPQSEMKFGKPRAKPTAKKRKARRGKPA